jgi:hypothetical protein
MGSKNLSQIIFTLSNAIGNFNSLNSVCTRPSKFKELLKPTWFERLTKWSQRGFRCSVLSISMVQEADGMVVSKGLLNHVHHNARYFDSNDDCSHRNVIFFLLDLFCFVENLPTWTFCKTAHLPITLYQDV